MEGVHQSLARRSRLWIFALLLVTSLPHISEAKFYSAEPSNPTVAVLGVNSTRVVLHWNYSRTEDKIMMFSITRYKENPDRRIYLVFSTMSEPVKLEPSFNDGRFEFSSPATLVINNVTEADEYMYRCIFTVSSKDGKVDEISSVQLNVYALPKISNVSGNQVVIQDKDVELVCVAEGRPTPTVTWTRVSDGAQVNSSFKIRGKQDKGKYRCTASNGVGSPAVAYTNLDVQYLEQPKILPKLSSQSNETLRVRTNSTLIVRCSSEAVPKANFKWLLHNRQSLTAKADYIKEKVGPKDEGTYKCVAVNRVGLTKWNSVKVEVVPLLDGPQFAYNMTFRIIRKCWNDGYEDNRTDEYKNLSNAVTLELILVYGGEASFIGIKVLNFSCLVSDHGDRAGSVLVDFQAVFDKDIAEKYALAVLRNATKDGVLGNFKVEAESPRLLHATAETTEAPTPETTEPTTAEPSTTKIRSNPKETEEVLAVEDENGASGQRISIILFLGCFFVGVFLV